MSTSRFLALPLELREMVYTEWSYLTSSFEILQVCRRIRVEAKPAVYRRPLVFQSQFQLLRWLDCADPAYLYLVTVLRFRVCELEFSSFLGSLPQGPSRQLLIPEEYSRGLQTLLSALQELPNISNLTIEQPDRECSVFLCSYMRNLLAGVTTVFPQLLHLNLQWDSDLIYLLEWFPLLRSLQLWGPTCRSLYEGTTDLPYLRNLTELKVRRPKFHESWPLWPPWPWLNGSILQLMPALTSLTIDENSNNMSGFHMFCDEELFFSLQRLFARTLRTLRIFGLRYMDSSFRHAFSEFISNSSLKTMEVSWKYGQDLDSRFFEWLPRSLQQLGLGTGNVFSSWPDRLYCLLAAVDHLDALCEVIVRTQPPKPSSSMEFSDGLALDWAQILTEGFKERGVKLMFDMLAEFA